MRHNEKLIHIGTITGDFAVSREIERYVPLRLSFGTPVESTPIYWSLRGKNSGLIEIGVDQTSGRLLSFTVVSFDGMFAPLSPEQPDGVQVGVPMFSRDLWPTTPRNLGSEIFEIPPDKRYYDVVGRGYLELEREKLRVRLYPDEIVYQVRISADVVCEFNLGRALCSLLVENLSIREFETLREYM